MPSLIQTTVADAVVLQTEKQAKKEGLEIKTNNNGNSKVIDKVVAGLNSASGNESDL